MTRDLLRSAIDLLPLPLFVKSLDGVVLYANDAFRATVASRPTRVVGRAVDSFLDRTRAEFARATDAEVVQHCKVLRFPYLLCPERAYAITKAPLISDTGSIEGIVAFTQDVTEHRRADQIVRRLTQNRDHELRNLLAAIPGIVHACVREFEQTQVRARVEASVSDLAASLGMAMSGRPPGDVEEPSA